MAFSGKIGAVTGGSSENGAGDCAISHFGLLDV